jgi:hypothetical protein
LNSAHPASVRAGQLKALFAPTACLAWLAVDGPQGGTPSQFFVATVMRPMWNARDFAQLETSNDQSIKL